MKLKHPNPMFTDSAGNVDAIGVAGGLLMTGIVGGMLQGIATAWVRYRREKPLLDTISANNARIAEMLRR